MYGPSMDLVTRSDTTYPLTNRHRPMLGPERGPVIRDVVAWYEAGASVRNIADHIGKSYGFVHRMLVDAGVTLRPRGAPAGAVHGRGHRSGGVTGG